MLPLPHSPNLLLIPVHILSHQDLRGKHTSRVGIEHDRDHIASYRVFKNEVRLYLSFEDDVECVCLCSFTYYNILVLVLHLREESFSAFAP